MTIVIEKFTIFLIFQSEQKRFLHNHKQHIESYSKAESTVKKYRKKQGRKNCPVDKELKVNHLATNYSNYNRVTFTRVILTHD